MLEEDIFSASHKRETASSGVAPSADRAENLRNPRGELKFGAFMYCAFWHSILLTIMSPPFFLGIDEDTPAFKASRVHGNISETWKRGLPILMAWIPTFR